MTVQRLRTETGPSIYLDLAGNDSWDGLTDQTPVQTIERAMEVASGGFDLVRRRWLDGGPISPQSYMGRRLASDIVTIKAGPAPRWNPHILTKPLYCDGLGSSGPIAIVGNAPTPQDVNFRCDAVSRQGFTAQRGGCLHLHNFNVQSVYGCTSVNTLWGGHITIGTLLFGPTPQGTVESSAIGAADGSLVELLGPSWLWGPGFGSVVAGLQGGQIIFAPGHSINMMNPMGVDLFINLMGNSRAVTYGSPFLTGGVGLPYLSGQKARVLHGSYLGFHGSRIPGTIGTEVDANSSFYADPIGTPGGGPGGDFGGPPPSGPVSTVTWNPADKGSSIVLSEGNSRAGIVPVAGEWHSVRSTQSWNAGVVTASFVVNTALYGSILGLADASMSVAGLTGGSGNSAGVEFAAGSVSGNQFRSGFFTVVNQPTGAFTGGDIVTMAVNFENGTASLSRNGVPYANPWVTFPPHSALFLSVSQHDQTDTCKIQSVV